MLATIQIGSIGDLVKVAQYLVGYAKRKQASSIYDQLFANVVVKWQAEHSLISDGIIGESTWALLAKNAPTCSTSKNRTSVYTCAIQLLLGGLTVDGVYGVNTKNAVAAFQSAAKLIPDGICGPKTWNALITGQESNTEPAIVNGKVLNNCVKYLQWNNKWSKVKYSTHTNAQTIGNSGCGPTSMAMILATWENNKITPVECCEEALKNGYRTYNSGTAWGYFKYVFKNHDCFSKYIETNSVSTLTAALREGALAVCSMNSNDNNFFTKGGHFVVAVGCDNNYIYYNDPNKTETPRKHLASKSQLCLKQAFIFWPITKKIEPIPTKNETIIINKNENWFDIKPEGKIIDISKWQGNINFEALKKEVGLVIVRASCGSDKDIKFDEYAQAMIKNRIPFGVYCYSYAGTVEKAKDEAKKLVAYSGNYPLFYIMDAEEAKITTDAIKAFAQELRANTTKKIGCYVAHHRYKTYKYDTLKDLFEITWIPCYGSNNGTIAGSKKPSYECDLWQYTSTGKIAGINGNVDMNITMKEGRDLKWFLDNNVIG